MSTELIIYLQVTTSRSENSVDPDQVAQEATLSGSTLFLKPVLIYPGSAR